MIRFARLLAAVVALVSMTATVSARVAHAADAGTTTAVIVIDTGSSVRAITVDVVSGMSGLAVLQRVANVTTLAFSGNGGAVCSIDGVGNEASQSACLVGPNSQYWAYFHSSGGATSWTYSPVGPGSFTVHGGDVEGWRYGTGQKPNSSAAFCDFVTCAPPATTTPPSGSPGGAAGGSTGSAAPGSGGAGPGATGSAATGAAAADGDAPSADLAVTTTTVPVAGAADGSSATRSGNGVRVEAAAASTGGGSDSGSPAGVAIAAGILAIAAGSAFWLRRRSRVPG